MSSRAVRPPLPWPALGLSLGLHLLVLLLAATPSVRELLASLSSLAASAARQASGVVVSPEEREILVPEVTLVPAPSAPAETFIRTDDLPEVAPTPGTKRFISDRDTRASSAAVPDPAGAAHEISQEGIDVPAVEVIRREQVDGEEEETAATAEAALAAATPPPPPSPPLPNERATPLREPAPSTPPPPPAENIALAPEADVTIDPGKPAEKTPAPADDPRTEKKPPAPALRDATALTPPPPVPLLEPPRPSARPRPSGAVSQRRPTQLRGAISNQGPASVDAENTASGRYMRQVTSAIEAEWHRKRRAHADFVTYGTIKLEFYVNKRGQVESLQIKNRDGANAVMQDFTLNAVLDAKIPPMPPGLGDLMENDRMLITYDIIVY